jgi:hypothetical protein
VEHQACRGALHITIEEVWSIIGAAGTCRQAESRPGFWHIHAPNTVRNICPIPPFDLTHLYIVDF